MRLHFSRERGSQGGRWPSSRTGTSAKIQERGLAVFVHLQPPFRPYAANRNARLSGCCGCEQQTAQTSGKWAFFVRLEWDFELEFE